MSQREIVSGNRIHTIRITPASQAGAEMFWDVAIAYALCTALVFVVCAWGSDGQSIYLSVNYYAKGQQRVQIIRVKHKKSELMLIRRATASV